MSPAPPLSVLSLLLEALAVLNSCCKTQLESVVSSGIGAQCVDMYCILSCISSISSKINSGTVTDGPLQWCDIMKHLCY